MILEIYNPPKIKNQFEFLETIKPKIAEGKYAINIDCIEHWHVACLIEHLLRSDIRTVTFTSQQNGKLFALGLMFSKGKLWFVDTKTNSGIINRIDNQNFLTVSRY